VRIWRFKGSLLPILIIVSMVAPAILLISISPRVIGVSRNHSPVWDFTAENYKKGNNIAGVTTSYYTNFNPDTHGNEKDNIRSTYLEGGWTWPGDQICTLEFENYERIYSIYWKVRRTLFGVIDEMCYLKVHKIDGWQTIDQHLVGPWEGFEKEIELNGQSIDKVQFYGVSRQIDLQHAQWWVYEIEIYEALPWPPVLVSISPSSQEGAPGEKLAYASTIVNAGENEDNYHLSLSDSAGWSLELENEVLEVPAGENQTTTLTVTIPENAEPGTEDNITVTATSQTDNAISNSDTCIGRVKVVRGVKVLISPSNQENLPGGMLNYAITVSNTGNVPDNYSLENSDNAGWVLSLDNDLLTIPVGENQTTTLRISVPVDAMPGTEDFITVIATSKADNTIGDNDSCIARVVSPWTGTVKFKLENLYKVRLEKDLQLNTGSKLVVKFYEYDNALQAESIIENFVPTTTVKENENVPHPLGAPVPPTKYPGGTVQIARLVLTTDNTEEVISTISSLSVHQSDLRKRFFDILGEWFKYPEQHDAFRAEVMDILLQWFSAPP